MSIDGILNINKPSDKTSFEVVSLIRKLSGQRRVGHSGTLDPSATGVLPICIGQGTRVTEFLMEATKTYLARIELGVATDTYDACGRVTQRGELSRVSQGKLEETLASFQGSILQTPPIYSAVRYRGKRLYELARAGIEVVGKARKVEIFRLELVSYQLPLITLEVECGKGTYIRSLAHDLGQALGCGAHVRELVRSKYGLFHIEDALPLSEAKNAFQHGYWQNLLFPIDAALIHWGAIIIDKEEEKAIRNGQPLPLAIPHQDCCRVYTLEGHFLAVLRFQREKGVWQPDKVFQ